MNQTTSAARRFEVKGINDDRDFCMCCGKTGLKRVVWIEDSETQEVRHYGVVCATNPAKAFGLKKEISEALQSFKRREQAMLASAYRRYKAAGGKYVSNGIPLHLAGGAVVPADKALWESCKIEANAALVALSI